MDGTRKRKLDEIMDDYIQTAKQPKTLYHSMLSKDGTLKYDFMTSLQNIVSAKIITQLWMNQDTQQKIVDILDLGIRPGKCGFDAKWHRIEKNVITKLLKLSLANCITKKLIKIVPPIGHCILNWIIHHDKYVFRTENYSVSSSVQHISNLTWTARGEIDYAQTAYNILSNQNSGLCSDQKYILACTYCLEDEIAILAPKVVNRRYLKNVLIDMHPMVYFWTAHITGDITNLGEPRYYRSSNRPNSNISINEQIMTLLIKNIFVANRSFNEVPIRYMWNKLTDEEKAGNISSLMKTLGGGGFRYSLLSNLDYEQQQEIFKRCSGSILCTMFNGWLWREYFLPTALHVLDIMNPTAFSMILKELIREMYENSQEENKNIYNECKFMFRLLWQEGSRHLKDYFFERENRSSLEKLLFVYLSWTRDMDIIELIFHDLNIHQKKSIIFGNFGISHCVFLIENDQWDLLELFINYTLSSAGDIRRLKKRLRNDQAGEIAEHFLKQAKLDELEFFMSWVFESEKEINQFRRSLAYLNFDDEIRSIIASNEVDFTNLENHFKWCAQGDVEVINRFKKKIPGPFFGAKLITELIKQDKYDLLDQILNWCFLHKQRRIELFKSNMYKHNSSSWSIRLLTTSLIEKDNSCKMFDKFIGWLFRDEEEAKHFKIWVLYTHVDRFSICTDFLREHKFEVADKLVEKCVTSQKNIARFKRNFMLSKDIKVVFDGYFEEEAQDDLPVLIKWFDPCKDTVTIFKNYFSEKRCPSNFYKLLDEFIQNKYNIVRSNGASSNQN